MSHGGWLYEDENEFKEILKKALNNESDNKQKGEAGYEYVMENYSWKKAMKTFDDAIDYVVASNAEKA